MFFLILLCINMNGAIFKGPVPFQIYFNMILEHIECSTSLNVNFLAAKMKSPTFFHIQQHHHHLTAFSVQQY